MNDSIVRRSARLLNAVLQLHKEGYQNLAIYPGLSPSGLHWRCELHPYQNLAIDDGVAKLIEPQHGGCEEALHTSGESGNQYFGWADCESSSARELAKIIAARFPRLLEKSHGENREYSGWLVSAVGLAESGNLPVHYSDCGTEKNPQLLGSFAHNKPPLQVMLEVAGFRSVFSKPPHLRPEDDWHSAYIETISSWRQSGIRRLPEYPIETQNVFEVGAYWEGAIWYIQNVLSVTSITSYLDQLQTHSPSSERWKTFFAVWNSIGQLEYLNAFLIRRMLSYDDSHNLSRANAKDYEEALQLFEVKHRSVGETFPNPYFGGTNPLHLGLILSDRTQDNFLTTFAEQ